MQTICFVTFNLAGCRRQYFVWYFCLLPLAVPLCFRAADEKHHHEKMSVFSRLRNILERFIGLRVFLERGCLADSPDTVALVCLPSRVWWLWVFLALVGSEHCVPRRECSFSREDDTQ